MTRHLRLFYPLVLALCGAAPAFSQQQPATNVLERGSVVSPVLIIDSERAFIESAFGKRVTAEAEVAGEKLAAENRLIEADLEAEEKELTALRLSLPADEFRVLANAFDTKVQETRAAQAAKGRALNVRISEQEDVFRGASGPVLERLMRESGAAVILERRSVYVSLNVIDITGDAISLLDETLGSGVPPKQP